MIMSRLALRIFGTLMVLCAASNSALTAEPHWPPSLTIGTASPGGTYYAYGDGLASLLARQLGIAVSTRSTEGPSENIRLLEAGEIELAFVTLGVAQQAWNGAGEWTGGRQYRSMRALFPMYDTPFHFVALRESELLSGADLDGRRIGIGPRGGTTATYVPEFFKVLKLSATFDYGDWADLATQLHEKALDALVVGAGVPLPAVVDLERKSRVHYLPLTADQIVALRLAMPELGPSVIPAGIYPSLARHYQTVGLYNFAIAHVDLPEDLAYAIVDAVFAHHDLMMEIHPAAAETVPANFTRNTFLPFHVGANRWYHNKAAAGVVRGD
jgi:TRAP transporter TAXI family solute receptor